MKLFEPITIRSMELRNRIVYPAIQMNVGLTNKRARAYYGERARGGAGLIITGGTAIDALACEELWDGAEGLKLFLKRLNALTDEVHSSGARIGMQLWQGNRFPEGKDMQSSRPDAGDGELVAPSARDNMRELTVPEIESIIYRFSKASRNVRNAGFDCVELHGAHAYLPCQFTSPELNRRTDKYGRNLSGRMKFGIDLVTAVRAFIGPDFPMLFRLGALDRDGVIHPDSVTYAQELEKAGVDCIDVSTSSWGSFPMSPTKRDKVGTLVPLAEATKKNVNVPVIGVGRINTPDVAERILERGQADMVAIARQLIADPFWPQKVLEGRQEEIVACKSCNAYCFGPTSGRIKEGARLCKVNERVGKEWEIPAA